MMPLHRPVERLEGTADPDTPDVVTVCRHCGTDWAPDTSAPAPTATPDDGGDFAERSPF